MKKIVSSVILLTSLAFSQNISVTTNWQLLAATQDIEVSNLDNTCIDTVWLYNNQNTNKVWKLYKNASINTSLPSNIEQLKVGTIPKGSGFWIKGKKSCDVDTTVPTEATDDDILVNENVSFVLSDIAGKTLYPNAEFENRIVFNQNGNASVYHTYNTEKGKVNEPWGKGSYAIKNGKLIVQYGEGTCFEYSIVYKYDTHYHLTTRISFMCQGDSGNINANDNNFDFNFEPYESTKFYFQTIPK